MDNRKNNSSLSRVPPPIGLPTSGGPTADALGVAHDLSAVTYYQRKLIQPVWKQIIFNAQTGLVFNYPWSQAWTPMSLQLVNPNDFPVYVAPSGPDPVGNGVAFPPLTGMRIPLSATAGVTVGLNATDVNLTLFQYLVHLFFYPTAD
jgi:hypothetical protein